ncbi:hypothetical protein WS91_11430 [Burkholderia sp. MSMB1498]|nr:hypothetical protein WS91_11430 [Burkholderia sp. MSMB1498]
MPNDARRIGRLVSVRAEGSSVTERDRPQAAHVAFEASGGRAPVMHRPQAAQAAQAPCAFASNRQRPLARPCMPACNS